MTDQYLVRIRGDRSKAHIWRDGDTLCRMYSTGGIKASRYMITDSPGQREICQMCAERKVPELQQDDVVFIGVDVAADGMTTECTVTLLADGTIRVDGIHRYDPSIDPIEATALAERCASPHSPD